MFLIVTDGSEFKLQLRSFDADTDNEIQGIAEIGEKLKFEINLQDPTNTVKTSPQNCYATRFNGTGRYNLISNRYAWNNLKSVSKKCTILMAFMWKQGVCS